MRFFGINQGPHDGGVACFDDDGELLLFSQTERLTRKKSDGHAGDLNKILSLAKIDPLSKTDLFFGTWPSHYPYFLKEQLLPDGFFEKKCSKVSGFNPELQVHFLNHHLCHVAASWMFRDFDLCEDCLYIAIDGMGVRADGSAGFYSAGVISATKLQELDYALDKFRFSPHYRLNRIAIPSTDPTLIAGKLMGLTGYIPQEQIRYLSNLPSVSSINMRIRSEGMTGHLMTQCANLYYTYICDIKNHLAKILETYSHKTIVVGGGAFLALELNSWLIAQGRNLVFTPAVNDSGIALGSAAYGYFLAKGRWPKCLRTPYLQWHPADVRSNYLSPIKAAEFLFKDGILAVLIGKGEAGPRALGNRSLLARPSKENARRVSVEIKGREFYRPVAPIVTDRDFANWFSGPQGYFMQYRNHCTPQAKEIVPGVIHNDNTSRAQVLRYRDHPWLYELLTEVGKLTGAECLINTSLNGRGRPICNVSSDVTNELDLKTIQVVNF
jgi:carbamoyltransferase